MRFSRGPGAEKGCQISTVPAGSHRLYDEKPGIQAIATTGPDLPPEPGIHATCSPGRFMPWSATATAAVSSSSGSLMPPIRPAPRLS